MIEFDLNGRKERVDVDASTPLLWVLRDELGLTGTKFGCGIGQCGACNILMDGKAVPSCRIPVRSVQGREIVTLEGLGTAEDLHPLQKAFIDEQAVQCGFCVSGMIITAKALLDRNPHPTDADIRAEMAGNLCRCGVYERISRVIKRVSSQRETVSGHGGEIIHKPGVEPA